MRRTFAIAFTTAVLAALALAGFAQAAGPAWMISSNHFPTNVQPGTTVYYSVVATNVGTSVSVGPPTATVTLPWVTPVKLEQRIFLDRRRGENPGVDPRASRVRLGDAGGT